MEKDVYKKHTKQKRMVKQTKNRKMVRFSYQRREKEDWSRKRWQQVKNTSLSMEGVEAQKEDKNSRVSD